jgi:Asp-tRNA(Asn)/Glu-tRNA(Gln) amidotransferase A subunit family amidase
VLERGSVEGNVFHRGVRRGAAPRARGAAAADEPRSQGARPSDRPQLAGDDAFRFRHLLIRDAAYDALPKAERADLHQSFAAWLEQHGAELVELDEILGYHLEQPGATEPSWERLRSELMTAARGGWSLRLAARMLRDDSRGAST